jgi:hypothetical protein
MTAPSKDIDLGRSGVGKSLMRATGGWGCEREAWYGETVRDPAGKRLRFAMPERVHFGSAIDVAHGYLFATVRDIARGEIEAEAVDWGAELTDAIAAGMTKARTGLWDQWPAEEADPEHPELVSWDVFRLRLTTALEKLLGILPNRVDAKGQPTHDDSKPGPPLMWIEHPEDVLIQGNEGETLRVERVVGDLPLIGTPDYVRLSDGGEWFEGWVDVKATSRAYIYPAKWAAAEPVLYDMLLTALNAGALPASHAYLEYRRNVKPYWHYTEAEVRPDAIALARGLIARWTLGLASNDPDTLSFSTSGCGECPFREAIPNTDHPGCHIGQAVVGITGVLTDD